MLSGFTEGAAAVGSYLEKETEKDVLKKAYSGAEKEATSPEGAKQPVDMFKVNSIAQQMAAQQGYAGMADKFGKAAQQEKENMYGNQLNEAQANLNKIDQLERQLQMINTPEDALKALSSSNLPMQQQLGLMKMIKEQGIDATKKAVSNAAQSSKERETARINLLDYQRKLAADKETVAHHRNLERNQAAGLELREGTTAQRAIKDRLSEEDKAEESYNKAVAGTKYLPEDQRARAIADAQGKYDKRMKRIASAYDDEDSKPAGPGSAPSGSATVTPEEVSNMSEANIKQLMDGTVSESDFEKFYGKPHGWAKKVVDTYRSKQEEESKPKARGRMEQMELDALEEKKKKKATEEKTKQESLKKGREDINRTIEAAKKLGYVLVGTAGFNDPELMFRDPKTGETKRASELKL